MAITRDCADVCVYVCASSLLYHLIVALLLCDTAAAAPGPVNVTACASSFGSCCDEVFLMDTIQVKFCPRTGDGSDFFVYQLKNAKLCDTAYCAIKETTGTIGTSLCFTSPSQLQH